MLASIGALAYLEHNLVVDLAVTSQMRSSSDILSSAILSTEKDEAIKDSLYYLVNGGLNSKYIVDNASWKSST